MCGINGIVGFGLHPPNLELRQSATADPKVLRRYSTPLHSMNQALLHRGPDGRGVWEDEYISLGHTRLSVMDLTERSSQPMVSECGRYVLSYNGEIYNFKELRSAYAALGPWNSKSDTEVLLRLFSYLGTQSLSQLEGMFAFAIWDIKERKLILGRDPFGIKPLYYTLDRNNQRLLFSSEIKGLLAAGITPRANLRKVSQFLLAGALDFDDDTWFEDIYSVAPGTYLTFQNGNLSTSRYYDLSSRVNEAAQITIEDFYEQFTSRLRHVIKQMLTSDRKIGLHLSGGMDSSILALVASLYSRETLNTFTFGYRESDYDESMYAREVADVLGVSHSVSYLAAKEVPTLLSKTLLEHDEPFTSFRQLSHSKLYADFAHSGPTVILEGAGGDEIGAGYRAHLLGAFLDMLPKSGRSTSLEWLFQTETFRGLREEDRSALLASMMVGYSYPGIAASDGTIGTDPRLVSVDFRKKYDSYSNLYYKKPFKSYLRNQQFIDIIYAKLPRGLRYIDRASSAVGREARLPLLDCRLVELGLSASSSSKINESGVGRAYFREVASRLSSKYSSQIPALIGIKRSVADPQRDWIKRELSNYFQDVISSKACRERSIIDPEVFKKYFSEFNPSLKRQNSLILFQAFITEMWFQQVIDKPFREKSAS